MAGIVWTISNAIVTLVCITLIVILLKYGSKKIHYIWAFFSFVLGVWGFGALIAGLVMNEKVAEIPWRIALGGAILVPTVFYHFIATLGELRRKALVTTLYIYSIIYCIATLFGLVGLKIVYIFNSLYYVRSIDFRWKALIAVWFATILFSWVEIYRLFQKSSGYLRVQFQYMFVGFGVGFIGGILNTAPFFGINFYPIGNVLICVYLVIVTYAILRHKLLDIEVIVKKTLVFAGLLASVFAILILPTLIIQEYLFRSASVGGRLAGLSISAAIIIFTMRKIESFFINITDKYLFQKKYDYKELLKTFTSEVLTVMNLDRLVNLTVAKLVDIIKLNSCAVLLVDDRRRDFVIAASYRIEEIKFSMPSPDEIQKLVKSGTRYMIQGETAGLIIPIILREDVIGLLVFGGKRSDDSYTNDDLAVLLPLARTLAIAISNAELVEELEKTQAEAAKKDTMATIGTLAAGMAHEIRNPVTTIRIFSEYLPDKFGDAGFRDKYKEMVVKEVDKIDHIIQTLVDFSSEDSSKELEGVYIPEAVENIISVLLLNTEISGRIVFSKNFSKNLPQIYVNKREFEEILLNLSQNAVHAIEDKGTVEFVASVKDNRIELEITDTGCGMSEDTLSHIFNPFYTTKAKGFGLGLFVVKQLVSRNRGKISVISEEGKGTRFTLAFQAI